MEKNRKIIILFLLIFFFPFFANAASLYFSPNTGSYNVNGIIPLGVYVSTPTEAMNAASGVISFPLDKLEVVSLSKVGSIFSLWVQEPSFSNSLGTINFEGVVFNPGYTGASGKIMTINFRVKKTGTSNVSFLTGSVLANDGNGTNILSGTGLASFTLNEVKIEPEEPKKIEETPKVIIPGTPLAPNIISSTHADPSQWYNTNDVKLNWEIGEDIVAARTLLNKSSNSIPSVTYEPAISEKEINDLADGIWYFHVQLKNNNGWGDVGHFRIQIDTQRPDSFKIELIDGKELDNPQPRIGFKATDSLSGIDYYNIKIGNDFSVKVYESELNNGVYTFPVLDPGQKIIVVQAFDKAENYYSAVEEITIKALNSPIITQYPKELKSNDVLIIKGESDYPNIQVSIYFERNKEIALTKAVKTNESGEFSFAYQDQLAEGAYKIWVEAINEKGLKSFPSESIDIIVKKPDFILISAKLVEILAATIPLIVLLVSFIFIIYRSYYVFMVFRRKLRKEVLDVEIIMKDALDLIKDDLNSQIDILSKIKDKRELTKEEEKIIKKLKKDVNYLERTVKKEIEDIKRQVK
ncbi:MAG TPA: cohesin domain-containing protein [Candidatus Pacearchaeota archaeon]|jgi:hypothetical protein|nr:hypothetical protein [Candidatus Parcubacteria bacterium]HNP79439.1 cohesin domain-containing protein [Candidatus Pacearchaeota archaeon]HOC53584.1 cohesin domain-containing protein [Candidatus Pacearchaeota archaeon]HQM24871.1 cohesin domain-containing protein [Candidatus Pacearchaeota archaeon]